MLAHTVSFTLYVDFMYLAPKKQQCYFVYLWMHFIAALPAHKL